MPAHRLTVRLPDHLYEQILSYKEKEGLGTINEAVGRLCGDGLSAKKTEDVLEGLRRVEEAVRYNGGKGGGVWK